MTRDTGRRYKSRTSKEEEEIARDKIEEDREDGNCRFTRRATKEKHEEREGGRKRESDVLINYRLPGVN